MGGKASKYGSVALTLDDPFFVAGGFVKGKVHIDCKQPFFANQLLLIIDGREYAEIDQKKKSVEYSNIIYANYMILHSFPNNQVLRGQYTFPFSFTLGSFLAGTFSQVINKKENASIKYYLKTELVSLNKEVDLKHSCQLIVREINKNSKPSVFQTDVDTNGVCCIPGGFATIQASLDKKIYVAGQSCLLTCKMDNLHSSSTFVLRAMVVQILSINGDEMTPHIFRDIIHQQELAPFRKKQATSFTIRIPLIAARNKKPLEPSTTGRIVDCKYQVQVLPVHKACCRTWPTANFALPFLIQAPGGISVIDAPGDWRPQTFDSQLLYIPNRDSYNRREGENPYITAMQKEEFKYPQ